MRERIRQVGVARQSINKLSQTTDHQSAHRKQTMIAMLTSPACHKSMRAN